MFSPVRTSAPIAVSLAALAMACAPQSKITTDAAPASGRGLMAQEPAQGAQTAFARNANALKSTQERFGRPSAFELSSPSLSNPQLAKLDDLFGGETPASEGAQLADTQAESAGRESGDSQSLVKYDTPIRDQASRGWCTGFATVGALENLLRQKTGREFDLSEYHHWTNYNQPQTVAALNAITKFFILPEKELPYSTPFDERNPSQYAPRTDISGKTIARLNGYRSLGGFGSAVLDALDTQTPVVGGVGMTEDGPGGGWADKLQEPPHSGQIKSYVGRQGNVGHAIVFVGYRIKGRDQNGSLQGDLILKNSWTAGWGDGGYGYLPFDYCSNYRCSFYAAQGAELNPNNPDLNGGRPTPAPTPTQAPTTRPTATPSPTQSPTVKPTVVPTVVPTVAPTTAPTVRPTAVPTATPAPVKPSDFSARVRWGYYYPNEEVQAFRLYLSSRVDLSQVAKVTYHIHPDFGRYQHITVPASAQSVRTKFLMPVTLYTYSSGWTTEGATVTLKDGRSFDIPGTDIDW